MERFNVCLYVETTLRGPGKRDGSAEWLVEFVSAKGDTVTRQGLFRLENTTETQITLRAIVEALKILKKPCAIRIFTDCTHIINVVSNRWHIWWKKAGWVNAKGRQVKNADLWEEFMQEMEAHVYTVESGHHSFKNIMQSDLEKPAILLMQGLNEFWGIDFTEEDFYKIYQHLGNAVNHEKTMRFVQSGFDMQELEVSYGATGTDKPV